MAKQNRSKDIEKDYETVNHLEGSQNMRADLDEQGGDVPWIEQSDDRQTQKETGRFQEDRNQSRR